VSVVVVLLGAAAAIYLFVFKKKDNGESPGTGASISAPVKLANALGARPDAGPAIKMAQVKVTSTPPGATVQADGQPVGGPTPTTLSLPADKAVKLTISLPCYQEDTQEITPSSKPAIDSTLKALEKVVHVSSEPKGATVLVDGKNSGATPVDVKLTGKLDPAKPHIFTLHLSSFDDATQTVNADSTCVTEGTVGAITLNQTLTPKQAAVVINTPPHNPHNPPLVPMASSAAASEAPPIPVVSSAAAVVTPPDNTAASSAPKETVTSEAKPGCGSGPACQPGEKCQDGSCCDPSPDAPDFVRCK
jgi:hypothetical protein